jgi:hypothetical protein
MLRLYYTDVWQWLSGQKIEMGNDSKISGNRSWEKNKKNYLETLKIDEYWTMESEQSQNAQCITLLF